VPNNHVFHTILVHFSYQLFGAAPWSIRLPVLIAGLLLILAVYYLGKALCNRSTGLLAAALTGFVPILVIKSVSARGYILVSLFTILSLLAGSYAVRHKNLFAWFCLSLFVALGFYSVPVMLFPALVIFVWLCLIGLRKNYGLDYQSTGAWWKYWFFSGFFAGVFTVIFYSPILRVNGVANFFHGATVVDPEPMMNFLSGMPGFMGDILGEWNLSLATPWLILLAAGIILSIILGRQASKQAFLLPVAAIIGVGLLLLIQRPRPQARIWLWLVPILILWSSAGFIGSIQFIFRRRPFQGTAVIVAAGLITIGFLINGLIFSFGPAHTYQMQQSSEVEKVTLYLKTILTPDDVVVVSDAADACYYYYFVYHGIPDSAIRAIKSRPFLRAYVIVYPNYKAETMENDIGNRGPDFIWFNLKTKRIVTQIGPAVIYEVDPFPESIIKAFGKP
jgi:hypothetical protein